MSEVTRAARIAAALLLFLVIISFHFLAPLTYGQPGLEPEEVNRRRVLSSWTLVRSVSAASPRLADYSNAALREMNTS